MSTPTTSSTHVSRCGYERLHRDPSHSPIQDECKKRKRKEATPQVAYPTGPATKKRRGRPAKVPDTPTSQGTTTSSSSTPLAAHQRYPLRSRGQLSTPESSQQRTPETQEGPEDTKFVAEVTTPLLHQNSGHGSELDDTIMVDNSTIASSADSDHFLDRSHSPYDASIVRETPPAEQPGLEIAGVQDHMFPFARRASKSENPFIGRFPIDNRFSRRLASIPSSREEDNIHYTTRGGRSHNTRDYQAEADGLRISRTALREHLEASTALVHTLQNRLLENEGNTVANRVLFAQAQADLVEARSQAQGGRTSVVRLGSTLAIFVFGMAAYTVWIWVNGPEIQYIRKRRADVLVE